GCGGREEIIYERRLERLKGRFIKVAAIFFLISAIHVYSFTRVEIARRKKEEDIKELNKGLEKRVQERTAQLENANRELDTFAYTVSHDLRAPLRAIDGFSTALLKDYWDKLDEEGKTYLRYLQEGSQEMRNLIDGLLSLSRSSRGELSAEQVDLSSMATIVVNELHKAEPDRRVSIHITPNVKAYADRQLLRSAMENLLGNAWKYTSQRSDGRIEFGAEERGGKTVYFVRDNGAGFDMSNSDKLFLPFHRLHKAAEFPGIGIGLATVERIIHRHNGQIWAQAAVGEGATFYFTLG
ncbi:MAG: ATP-binding protein, partial [Desulfuromonadaceae bacterium]